MPTVTLTLKSPSLDLNKAKVAEWDGLQRFNTEVANGILKMPKEGRKKLTMKAFGKVKLGSAWTNQTIRNVKVKRFKLLSLETNNQNWTLHKVGSRSYLKKA